MKELFKEIWDLQLSIDRTYEQYAKNRRISFTELGILYYLEGNPNPTQKELSLNLLYPKQTINSILQSYVTKGYATLEYRPGNKKEKVVVLTEEGIIYKDNALRKLYKIEDYVGYKMGIDSAKQLEILLDEYLNYLKEAMTNEQEI